MGWLIDLSKREGDVHRFNDALKQAKAGLHEACEIWESMKQDFTQIGDYNERYNMRGDYSHRGDYYQRGNYGQMSERDWQELQERRHRDGMGRYM